MIAYCSVDCKHLRLSHWKLVYQVGNLFVVLQWKLVSQTGTLFVE